MNHNFKTESHVPDAPGWVRGACTRCKQPRTWWIGSSLRSVNRADGRRACHPISNWIDRMLLL